MDELPKVIAQLPQDVEASNRHSGGSDCAASTAAASSCVAGGLATGGPYHMLNERDIGGGTGTPEISK